MVQKLPLALTGSSVHCFLVKSGFFIICKRRSAVMVLPSLDCQWTDVLVCRSAMFSVPRNCDS